MAGQVVYVDRFTIREGQAENFRRYAEEMSELVKAQEPDALSFHYFVDESNGAGTAVFIFTDAAALDHHLEVMSAPQRWRWHMAAPSRQACWPAFRVSEPPGRGNSARRLRGVC